MSASLKLLYLSKSVHSIYKEAESDYIKRIGKYCSFQTIHIAPIKNGHKMDTGTLLNKESLAFHKSITPKTFLILLDEKGKSYSSTSLSKFIDKTRMAHKEIVFVIGGAFGFSTDMYKRANHQLALSDLTYPHELARLIFIEQLYRSFTILNNEKYHHV